MRFAMLLILSVFVACGSVEEVAKNEQPLVESRDIDEENTSPKFDNDCIEHAIRAHNPALRGVVTLKGRIYASGAPTRFRVVDGPNASGGEEVSMLLGDCITEPAKFRGTPTDVDYQFLMNFK